MNIMMQLLYKMFSINVLHSNQAVLFINGQVIMIPYLMNVSISFVQLLFN